MKLSSMTLIQFGMDTLLGVHDVLPENVLGDGRNVGGVGKNHFFQTSRTSILVARVMLDVATHHEPSQHLVLYWVHCISDHTQHVKTRHDGLRQVHILREG